MRTNAGRYNLKERRIELNPHVLTDVAKLTTTLGHEYAHALAHSLAPAETAHGPTWRAAMAKLGLPPTTCHQYPTAGLRRSARVLKVYECPACRVRWEVRRRYSRNCYHPCAANKEKLPVRLVGFARMVSEE